MSKEGSYLIPSIELSYFDPTNKIYKSTGTKNIAFNTLKGKKRSLQPEGKNSKDENLSWPEKIIQNKGIVLLFGIGLLIAGLIFWMTKDRNGKAEKNVVALPTPVKIKTSTFDVIGNPLTKTEDCFFKNDCQNFYNILNDELKAFLALRFNISVEELTNKRLGIVMDKVGITNSLILQTQDLIKEIEWQLYTPFERNEELNNMYAKAQNLVLLLSNNQ